MNWCVLLMKVVDGLRCVLLMNWCVLLMNWCVLLMKVVDGLGRLGRRRLGLGR